MDLKKQFFTYIKSSFPLMYMPTVEIERASDTVQDLIKEFNKDTLPNLSAEEWLKTSGLEITTWDCNNGLKVKGKKIPDTIEPEYALGYILRDDTKAGVFLFENFHFVFRNTLKLPKVVQYLRDIYLNCKAQYKYLILIGNGDLPSEIRPYFELLDFPLPDNLTLQDIIKQSTQAIGMKLKDSEIKEAAIATQGMSAMELTGAVCIAATQTNGKALDKGTLFQYKAQSVKQTGLMEYIESGDTVSSVGGLTELKGWFFKLAKAFNNRERAAIYKLPIPKGCLIAGISGTGKTLCAMVIANLFGVPLFRLDVGRIFAGIVGETERNYRDLFRLIDSVSPCVILIDECEKALAGLQSSDASDSGVTARFIGALLSYLNDKKCAAFFVFTANDVTKLPPELLRKGRIDELWFVDLPAPIERKEIFTIHLNKVRNAEKFDIPKLVEYSEDMTGAEIEGSIKQAMFDAFFEDREFTTDDITNSIQSSVALIKTKAEDISILRAWAKDRARLANGVMLEAQRKKRGKGGVLLDAKEHWAK